MNAPYAPYFTGHDDPDVVSIRSSAPSYTSALPPSYDACIGTPTPSRSPQHLQHLQQQYRTCSSLLSNGSLAENYNIASWSSLAGSGHQNRAYANVAARRAQRDEAAREMDEAVMVMRSLQENIFEKGEDVVDQQHTEHSLAQEAKGWDHLIIQMADWEKRERNWSEFKKRYESGRKKKVGRGVFGKLS